MVIMILLASLFISLLSLQVTGGSYYSAENCGSFYGRKLSAKALCPFNIGWKLMLDGCQIQYLDREAFACGLPVEFLYLRYNMIASLPVKVFQPMTYLIHLSLPGR